MYNEFKDIILAAIEQLLDKEKTKKKILPLHVSFNFLLQKWKDTYDHDNFYRQHYIKQII